MEDFKMLLKALVTIAILGWGLGLGLAFLGAAQENEMSLGFNFTVGCFLILGFLSTLGGLITLVWS
jgi:hypothetical protein